MNSNHENHNQVKHRIRFIRLVVFIRHMISSFGSHEIHLRAAALAFHGMLSSFPFLLFLVFFIGEFRASEDTSATLLQVLNALLPAYSYRISDLLDEVLALRGTVGVIGGIWLLWSSSSMFITLESALDVIWEAPQRSSWRRRLFAGLIIVIIGIILIGTWIGSILFEYVIPDTITMDNRWVSLAISLFVTITLLSVVFRGLPNCKVSWKSAIAGALFSTFAWQLTKFGFGWYLSSAFSRYGLIYGTLAWIMVLALWVYISGLIVLLGAELGASLNRKVWANS